MKIILLYTLTFIGFGQLIMAQTQPDCTQSCCTAQSQKLFSTKTSSPMMASTKNNNTNSKPTLSCKLTTPELQERKRQVMTQLRKQVLEKKSLANGYAYRFAASDAIVDELTTFIKTERMCCDFFDFTLKITADQSVWLELTGPEGVKSFVDSEIEL